MKRPFLAFFAALALSLPFALAGAPEARGDDGEQWSARLKDLDASYGQETWKYDLAYEGQASPNTIVTHLENQTTSYAGAVGLRATLKLEIYDTQDPAKVAATTYNITAYIPTSRGNLHAYVKRLSTSTNEFQLDFDLDGANNGDPRGALIPAADPGLQQVHVNIMKRVNDNPPTTPVGDAAFEFTYELPYQLIEVPDYQGLSHVQSVPDSVFRLFNDVGWDRSVALITRPVTQSTQITADFEFDTASAGQEVAFYAFRAERGANAQGQNAPAPAPTPPFIPGVTDNETLQKAIENSDRLIVVSRGQLGTATIDAAGHAALNVTGAGVLASIENGLQTGLIVVAPLLVSNFDPALCPGNCLGGSQYRIGATEFVVPITGSRAVIDGYRLSDPGITGSNAPGPLRDVALGVNSLQVFVRDIGGFVPPQDVRTGDVFAVVAESRSTEPLSGASLSPNQRDSNPGERQNLLSGNLQVRPIQAEKVSYYRILAFLYAAGDEFYGITWGDRGYEVDLASPPVEVPPGTGGVQITITSRTTNYDILAQESSFALKVLYQISVLELNTNETRSVTLKEAESFTDFYPLNASTAGQLTVVVSTTSGDVLPRPLEIALDFVEKGPDKHLADRIPGFEAAALVLAALAGLLIVGRRRKQR